MKFSAVYKCKNCGAIIEKNIAGCKLSDRQYDIIKNDNSESLSLKTLEVTPTNHIIHSCEWKDMVGICNLIGFKPVY